MHLWCYQFLTKLRYLCVTVLVSQPDICGYQKLLNRAAVYSRAKCFIMNQMLLDGWGDWRSETWWNWTLTCLKESMPKYFTVCLSCLLVTPRADALCMRVKFDWWPAWHGPFMLTRGNYPGWQVVWRHHDLNNKTEVSRMSESVCVYKCEIRENLLGMTSQ